MKRCPQCGKSKPLEAFGGKKTAPDGLQSWCRECNKARSKRYYQENKPAHRALMRGRNAVARAKCQEWVGLYLLEHPCVDCGEIDIRVLEFDHLGDIPKSADLSTLIRTVYRIERLEEEIAKCVVRCRNCHGIVTHERAQTWRSVFYAAHQGSLV